MLKGKKILLGITGGIAVYKIVDLVSKLKKEGAEVECIMTEAATKLVTPFTFEIMSRSKVHLDLFEASSDHRVEHIKLAEECDIMLVAPATANTIAKVACGIADNLLTSTILACKKRVLFAVSMNTNMLSDKSTISNLNTLAERGYGLISPDSGFLACNTFGPGRLREPKDLLDILESELTKKDLKGKKIIISAGPTLERIDPVRYICNDSSGKMGYSIARAARNRGAEVVLVAGPTKLEDINGVKTKKVNSNDEMFLAINEDFESCATLIMAAAPSDFKVNSASPQKIKSDKIPKLELVKNKDIVSEFGKIKENRIIIGFAAETNNLVENAKEKLIKKNMDYIVANDVTQEGAGFNYDTNIASIISSDSIINLSKMSKFELANHILDLLV